MSVPALVDALDRADFEAAAALIAPDAIYEKDGETITGASAIVASYRASHERATSTLDRIVYRSSCREIGAGTFRVAFEDHIELDGRAHCFRCEQDMSVGPSKLVERIVHRELDGERAALEVFLSKRL